MFLYNTGYIHQEILQQLRHASFWTTARTSENIPRYLQASGLYWART